MAINARTAVLGQQVPLRISFRGSQALVRSSAPPHAVTASVSVNGGALVIVSDDPSLGGSVALSIPALVRGIQFQDVEVANSEAVVTFILEKPRFEVKV